MIIHLNFYIKLFFGDFLYNELVLYIKKQLVL